MKFMEIVEENQAVLELRLILMILLTRVLQDNLSFWIRVNSNSLEDYNSLIRQNLMALS